MKPLRACVIGVGHLGKLHAKILSRMPEVELVAVVDPYEPNRNFAAKELQVMALPDVGPILPDLDLAIVATPTCSHSTTALPLLQRGIHTFVEKPLAMNASEAEQLAWAAEESKVVLQVGHVERFNPIWNAVVGKLGQPKLIEATRCAPHALRSVDIGVVLDLMIHDIDLALSLVRSPVVDVQALGIALLGDKEDAAQARVRFENGAVVSLSACRVSPARKRRMQVWTDNGYADIDLAERKAVVIRPTEVIRERRLRLEELSPAEREALRPQMAELFPMEEITAPANDPLTDELREFVTCVRQGTRPRVGGFQAYAALQLADAMLAAMGQHAWSGSALGPVGPRLQPAAEALPASLGVPLMQPFSLPGMVPDNGLPTGGIPAPHFIPKSQPNEPLRRAAG